MTQNLHILFTALVVAAAPACSGAAGTADGPPPRPAKAGNARDEERESPIGGAAPDEAPGAALATFAGGCFWCMEHPFESIGGVRAVIPGYTGGDEPDPTYEEVASGRTGHVEAVRVVYDPASVSYEDLLRVFWEQIDPTDAGGQFVDRGRQYRTAIFYHDEEQRALAERTRADLAASGRFDAPIVTEIVPAKVFYPAEEYHQDFYRKNPGRYGSYRAGSGRDEFLSRIWGRDGETDGPRWKKPADAELRARLTPLQYRVTQKGATEPAFRNAWWDNGRDGIYVDVVSGEPLFSSREKFDSKTGWPSFWSPLDPDNVVERRDRSLFTSRTEVRSRHADSHLGHVFDDGPAPTGRRYCVNSAALRFIPVEDLEKEGYGEYLPLFAD